MVDLGWVISIRFLNLPIVTIFEDTQNASMGEALLHLYDEGMVHAKTRVRVQLIAPNGHKKQFFGSGDGARKWAVELVKQSVAPGQGKSVQECVHEWLNIPDSLKQEYSKIIGAPYVTTPDLDPAMAAKIKELLSKPLPWQSQVIEQWQPKCDDPIKWQPGSKLAEAAADMKAHDWRAQLRPVRLAGEGGLFRQRWSVGSVRLSAGYEQTMLGTPRPAWSHDHERHEAAAPDLDGRADRHDPVARGHRCTDQGRRL